VARCRAWQHTLTDGGWAGITWPAAFGGRGGTGLQASIFDEEQNQFDVSTGAFAVAIGMVGPTLMVHGNDDQRAHLADILRGDELWCQLFSEPGAGSDLASLGTRAELDGDTWVVNGQKVWTSMAQSADYAILLARTDPDQPKHAGISYFMVDMRTPGIEIRPLRQITGIAHFNEVFLTDVRIPAANLVGQAGAGWKVAQTTLSNERAFIGSGNSTWGPADLITLARDQGRAGDASIRQDLARAYIRQSLLTYMGYRLRTAVSRGEHPGQVASVMKLAYSRHWARSAETAMDLLGADGMLWGEDAPDDGNWQQHLCSQFAVRIGGGTDEVQGNVIGERALGLPREPSLDRDVPWRELVRQ
jgi:acyl-CoA dehydrogenase